MVKKKWISLKNDFKRIVVNSTNHAPGFYGYLYLALIPLCSAIFFFEILVFGESSKYGGFEFVLRTFVDSFYFSIITITTLGYGDITPLSILGKITSAFESLSGIGLIGLFLNALSHRNAKEAQEEEQKVMRRELKEELLEDFERIASDIKSSSHLLTNQITGGDSYPLFKFCIKSNGEIAFGNLQAIGEYPLFDLKIHVKKADGDLETIQDCGQITPELQRKIKVDFVLEEQEKNYFNIFCLARNGLFFQRIVLVKNNGYWNLSTSVQQGNARGSKEKKLHREEGKYIKNEGEDNYLYQQAFEHEHR